MLPVPRFTWTEDGLPSKYDAISKSIVIFSPHLNRVDDVLCGNYEGFGSIVVRGRVPQGSENFYGILSMACESRAFTAHGFCQRMGINVPWRLADSWSGRAAVINSRRGSYASLLLSGSCFSVPKPAFIYSRRTYHLRASINIISKRPGRTRLGTGELVR